MYIIYACKINLEETVQAHPNVNINSIQLIRELVERVCHMLRTGLPFSCLDQLINISSIHIRVSQGEVLDRIFPRGHVDEDEALGDSVSTGEDSFEDH